MATAPWAPLRQAYPAAILIRDHLFKIGQDAYVIVSERDFELRPNHPEAPFIIAVLWAESEGAAVRAALRDLNADAAVPESLPPHLLLPDGTAKTYSELRKLGRKGTYGRFFEHADYRIDAEGAGQFANKIIQIGKSSYYFRSLEDISERTFAIRVEL